MIIFQEHDSGEAKGQTTLNHDANVNLTFLCGSSSAAGIWFGSRTEQANLSALARGKPTGGAYGGYGLTSLSMFNHI